MSTTTKTSDNTPGKPSKPTAPVDTSITPKANGRMLSVRMYFFLILLSCLMLWLAFPPIKFWPLALFALTPISLAILGRPNRAGTLGLLWLGGFIYFMVASFWLIPVTIGGYIGLSAYMAVYFPMFAILLRLWVVRLRIPALLAVPLAFTAAEFVRSTFMSGFSWFMVGTSLAPCKPLLQCADLAGVSGLTFLCGLCAGGLVDILKHGENSVADNPRRRLIPGIAALAILAAACVYGGYRLGQKGVFSPGPVVAVIESRIPQTLKDNQTPADEDAMFRAFCTQSLLAAKANPHVNLIVWPETMVPGDLNRAWLNMSAYDFMPGHGRGELRRDQAYAKKLAALSRQTGAAFLVGSGGIHFGASGRPVKLQNIAVYFTPRHGLTGHPYAKHHLVPFGEYIPFKHTGPLIHKWLLDLTPYGPNHDYSLTPGKKWRRFVLHVGSYHWKFGTPICYEDAMPHPCRMFARPRRGKKGVQFLVSISNDGWYQSHTELTQHLQLAQVRAVENRVPIARSVNGGDSGLINSDGQVLKLVGAGGTINQVGGFAVGRLPLDSRISLFSRTGDVFARSLVLLNLLMVLGVWTAGMARWLLRRRRV